MKNNPDSNRDPMHLFLKWFEDAVKTGMDKPEAMVLATASKQGIPSARVVLYKGVSKQGQGIRFFTNFRSRKGHELEENPRAAAVFYWSPLDRQVRIEGRIEKLSSEESDLYWKSRPRESQIGAWASPQSERISDRRFLEGRFTEMTAAYQSKEVPRPSHWGGFALLPERFEFWHGRDSRLHDRTEFQKVSGRWEEYCLAP